jgi:ribonuclease BN (tRNA processing enzyme)
VPAPAAPAPADQPRSWLHLTARKAGQAAAAARARRLLLTHFWPGSDREVLAGSAAEEFRGPVLIADEGVEVALP